MKIVCIGDPFVSAEFMREQTKVAFPDAEVSAIGWKDEPGMTREKFQPTVLKIELEGSKSFELDKEIYGLALDADIIITHIAPISKKFLESCRKLKFLAVCRGGTEHIDIAAANNLNIAVMNLIRNAEQTAEFTIGLMLAEVRNIARSHEHLKKGIWQRSFPNKEFTAALYELKVGLMGLGNVGRIVAKKLRGMGVSVCAWEPFSTQEELKKQGLDIPLISDEELFKTCDVISLHMRLTPKTTGFVNERLISLMKPTAYLINSARAGILSESALIDALSQQKIAGAALDVFWREPIPQGHPFLSLPNITISSHLAGDTISAISRSPILMVKKLAQYIKGYEPSLLLNSSEITIRRIL